jgi:hypothetical protein
MEIVEDIALGHFSTDELDQLSRQDESSARSLLRDARLFGFPLSIAISVLFHLALALMLLWLVNNGGDGIKQTELTTISVSFVPANPLKTQAEEASASLPAQEIDPATLEEPDSISSSLLEENTEPPIESEEISRPRAAELAERTLNQAPATQAETVTLPTSESVRQILSTIQNNEASRFYTYDCNKLDEEKEFNDCAPSDGRDYSSLTRNPVYDYHNPAVEISRSRETFTTIARQSSGISEQLALSNLPVGISAYLLEELEQGIETYSNDSPRTIDHMNTMTDKSAAGEMARRIFTPWVRQQSMILRDRKVESRADSQFRERCRSYEKFIMSPAQFARCTSMGESPLGFAVGF